MSAINPNHPVVQALENQWHKLLAIVMVKYGLTDVVITTEDIDTLANGDNHIAAIERDNTIQLKIVSFEEGTRLAREHGGLPG